MAVERTVTLPKTTRSDSPVDIYSEDDDFPVLNLPLHIGEERQVGNLNLLVADSSHPTQEVQLEFTKLVHGQFNLNDLKLTGGILEIGSLGRLALRGVNRTGFVTLVACIKRSIQVNSSDRF